MIADLGGTDKPELGPYDLCIVGSGPAGATLARELKQLAPGLHLAVLESGRSHPTPLGNRLRRVLSEGIVVRDDSRERGWGGTSTTWAGLSAPLDPIDLEPRPWANWAGWPLQYEELLACYRAAAERYRFPALAEFEPARSSLTGLRLRGSLQPQWQRLEEKIFLAAEPPQNFKTEWTETYDGPAVDLWQDATLLELHGEGNSRRVAYGRVRSSSGREHRVRAGVFVLAAGAIENARILLLSRDSQPRGLGNRTDQVGRCLMNHPKGNQGVVRFSRPVSGLPYFFGALHRGRAGYAGLRLRQSEQRRLGVLNSYVRLEPLYRWSDNPGIAAAVELARRAQDGRWLRRWKSSGPDAVRELRDWAETGDPEVPETDPSSTARLFLLALRNAPQVFRYASARLSQGPIAVTEARVRNFMEMEPDPDNRVILSELVDDYGTPLPLVRHRPTGRDRRSLVELHTALADELIRNGIGRLEQPLAGQEPWPLFLDASHHLGTTRMGTDPGRSVVNPDLRLHETDNVYLAGGSVFPTGGSANPTFTIVALSIRLATHLSSTVLRSGPRTVGSS